MTETDVKEFRYKLLIPVDGSENSNRAVQQAIRLAKTGAVAGVDLLHVQPPLLYVELLMGPQQKVIDQWTNKQGRAATVTASSLLAEGGTAFELYVESGEVADTIVAHVTLYSCDLIVMGTRGVGAIGNLVLGSVATKVINLAQIPVILVK